jgi:hypothetical protein
MKTSTLVTPRRAAAAASGEAETRVGDGLDDGADAVVDPVVDPVGEGVAEELAEEPAEERGVGVARGAVRVSSEVPQAARPVSSAPTRPSASRRAGLVTTGGTLRR